MTLDGIENDEFWIYAESGQSMAQVRLESMMQQDAARLHAPGDAVHASRLTTVLAHC